MASRIRLSAGLSFAAIALTAVLAAQAPPGALTLDAIYDPQARVDFSGAPVTNLTWLDSDTYMQTRRGERGLEWLRIDAASGRTTPLVDASRMPRANDVTLNPSRTGALLTIDNDLHFHDFASGKTTRLTSVEGDEEEATFSPDGQRV